MSEGIFDDFVENDEISLNDILAQMLTDDNIELKSQIKNPKGLASLYILGRILKSRELTESSWIIKLFINQYLKYQVSKDRLSRQEIIEAFRLNRIKSLRERESITTTKE